MAHEKEKYLIVSDEQQKGAEKQKFIQSNSNTKNIYESYSTSSTFINANEMNIDKMATKSTTSLLAPTNSVNFEPYQTAKPGTRFPQSSMKSNLTTTTGYNTAIKLDASAGFHVPTPVYQGSIATSVSHGSVASSGTTPFPHQTVNQTNHRYITSETDRNINTEDVATKYQPFQNNVIFSSQPDHASMAHPTTSSSLDKSISKEASSSSIDNLHFDGINNRLKFDYSANSLSSMTNFGYNEINFKNPEINFDQRFSKFQMTLAHSKIDGTGDKIYKSNTYATLDPTQAMIDQKSTSARIDQSTPVARIDQSAPVARLDQASTFSRFDQSAPVTRLDQSAPVARLDQSAPVVRLDQSTPVTRLDQSTPLARLDQSAPVARLDKSSTTARLDQSSTTARLDQLSTTARHDQLTPVVRLDQSSTTARLDQSTPVARLDPSSTITNLDQSVPVGRFNQSSTIARLDQSTPVARLDQSSLIARLDPPPTVVTLQSPTIARIDQLTNMHRLDQSPTTARLDQSSTMAGHDQAPKMARLGQSSTMFDESPTMTKIDQLPIVDRLNSSPTIFKLDSSPTMVRLDTLSTISTLDQSPTMTRLDSSPSTARLDASSIMDKIDPIHVVPTTLESDQTLTKNENDLYSTEMISDKSSHTEKSGYPNDKSTAENDTKSVPATKQVPSKEDEAQANTKNQSQNSKSCKANTKLNTKTLKASYQLNSEIKRIFDHFEKLSNSWNRMKKERMDDKKVIEQLNRIINVNEKRFLKMKTDMETHLDYLTDLQSSIKEVPSLKARILELQTAKNKLRLDLDDRETEVIRLRQENNETVLKMTMQFKQELEQLNQIQEQAAKQYFKDTEDKLNKQKETAKIKISMQQKVYEERIKAMDEKCQKIEGDWQHDREQLLKALCDAKKNQVQSFNRSTAVSHNMRAKTFSDGTFVDDDATLSSYNNQEKKNAMSIPLASNQNLTEKRGEAAINPGNLNVALKKGSACAHTATVHNRKDNPIHDDKITSTTINSHFFNQQKLPTTNNYSSSSTQNPPRHFYTGENSSHFATPAPRVKMIGEIDESLLNELQDQRNMRSEVETLANNLPQTEQLEKKKKKVRFNLPELKEMKKEKPSKKKDIPRCIDRNPFETALKLFGSNRSSGEVPGGQNNHLLKYRRATPMKQFDYKFDQDNTANSSKMIQDGQIKNEYNEMLIKDDTRRPQTIFTNQSIGPNSSSSKTASSWNTKFTSKPPKSDLKTANCSKIEPHTDFEQTAKTDDGLSKKTFVFRPNKTMDPAASTSTLNQSLGQQFHKAFTDGREFGSVTAMGNYNNLIKDEENEDGFQRSGKKRSSDQHSLNKTNPKKAKRKLHSEPNGPIIFDL